MSAQIPGSLLNPRISSSVLNQEIKTGKNLLRFFVERLVGMDKYICPNKRNLWTKSRDRDRGREINHKEDLGTIGTCVPWLPSMSVKVWWQPPLFWSLLQLSAEWGQGTRRTTGWRREGLESAYPRSSQSSGRRRRGSTAPRHAAPVEDRAQ
jgi:hypothetical protein